MKTMGAIVAVVIAGVVLLTYVSTREHGARVQTGAGADAPVPGTIVASSTLQTRVAPAGQKEYANSQYHVSVFYPQELSVTEYTEASGAHTISFENTDGSRGFQVYVVPYPDAQITKSRILLDTHNTATETPQEIVLANGTHALIFFSNGGALGKVREVWFLHGGFLYEVTTYADLDSWLSDILKTLTFAV